MEVPKLPDSHPQKPNWLYPFSCHQEWLANTPGSGITRGGLDGVRIQLYVIEAVGCENQQVEPVG